MFTFCFCHFHSVTTIILMDLKMDLVTCDFTTNIDVDLQFSFCSSQKVKKVLIFLYSSFERQQALVQEQLARLAQREKETPVTAGLDDLTPSLLIEKGKAHEEQEKVKMLVSHVLWAW